MTSRRIDFARNLSATLLAPLVVTAVLVCSVDAHAQCTMDRECERELICESGTCVEPKKPLPPSTTAPPAAVPPLAPALPPVAPPVTRAPPQRVAAAPVSSRRFLRAEQPPATVRYSKATMIIGEATVVVGGALFAIGLGEVLGDLFAGVGCGFGNFSSLGSNCGRGGGSSYGNHLMFGAMLAGAGIPLIVIGARRVPAPHQSQATMSPWVGRQSGGLSLRLEL